MSNNWTREDVHSWWRDYRKQMLAECGCEEEDHSVYDGGMYKPDFDSGDLTEQVLGLNGSDEAKCPDTYSRVAEHVCSDPHKALEAIRPIMQHIGVGCPQSFAKALVDMFSVSQDMGIIKPFNTEKI